MATKKELQAQADALGVKYTTRTTGEELQALIDEANGATPAPDFDGNEEEEAPKKPSKKSKFNADLVTTLETHKHILNVWINEAGEWYFTNKPGFTSYSREEILNG